MGCLSIYSRANETITMVSAPFLYPAKVYEILLFEESGKNYCFPKENK